MHKPYNDDTDEDDDDDGQFFIQFHQFAIVNFDTLDIYFECFRHQQIPYVLNIV